MNVVEDSSLPKSKWIGVVLEENERSQSDKCEEARNRGNEGKLTDLRDKRISIVSTLAH